MSAQDIGATPDGRTWLIKALDPAGAAVDVRGLPDVESHTCAVLNYQTQGDIQPPNIYQLSPSSNITYDADLITFQHPLIFGAAISYPTGTVDPLHYSRDITVKFGGTNQIPSIQFTAGTQSMFPRTGKVFLNDEIGATTLKGLTERWSDLCQRHRIIYGGAQVIPTCSMNDNSGSISVSQTILSGDRSGGFFVDPIKITDPALPIPQPAGGVYATDSTVPLNFYNVDDFPSDRSTMQNPQALITRFFEGAYIPYKLPNPIEVNFVNSGTLFAEGAPAWVVGASMWIKANPASQDTTYTKVGMKWNTDTNAFEAPKEGGNEDYKRCARRLSIEMLTKTGKFVSIVFELNNYVAGDQSTTFQTSLESPLYEEVLYPSGHPNTYYTTNSEEVSVGLSAQAVPQAGGEAIGRDLKVMVIANDGSGPTIPMPNAPISSVHMRLSLIHI